MSRLPRDQDSPTDEGNDSDFADESIPGDEEDDEEDLNGSDDEKEDDMEREIVVDFEAFRPEESDYEGVKKLLRQLFLREDVNTSDLANHLISIPDLTLILKQSDDDDEDEPDDDVYGVMSLVDLSKDNDQKCVESIRKYIVNNAKTSQNEKFKQEAQTALNGKSALILNERFINLPARISLPCFESLVNDMKDKPKLEFDHFFMITKVQKAAERKSSSSKKAKRQKVDDEGKNQTNSEDASTDTLFQNPEEEIFCEKAVQWLEFSVANQCDDDVRSGNWDEEDVKYCPFRRILLLDKLQFFAAIEVLKREFTGSVS